MGQGQLGGAMNQESAAVGALGRYRVAGLLALTGSFVAVKTAAHDFWAVAFGLAVLALILLTPKSAEDSEPWRAHALRVVSACFVVVTLGSIWTTLTTN
ncbi:MAG TPA: hypothetical protein VEQ58_06150 [Polyangiaceae bacterium]|nr:hypothetical protein [Polyangiaceae bacterium]